MRHSILFVLLGLFGFVSPLSGQSLFGSQGLGMSVEPLDARARSLGTAGVGILGISLSPMDIAGSAWIYLPSAQVSFQPQWVDGDLAGQRINNKGTRIPQMGIAYPIPRVAGTIVLHLGTFMDQRWQVQEGSSQEFRGEEIPVTDVFRSRGGISTFQLGWGQRVGESLSIGAGFGTRIGSVTRTFQRTIEAEGFFEVVPFEVGGEWQYSGLVGQLGFQWDPIAALRLGGSVVWSGDLTADPVDSTEGSSEDFDLPVEYRFGASGILTPRLTVSLGLTHANWVSSNEFIGPEMLAGSLWSMGGGVEWDGPSLGPRNFPIRLGVRRSDLPFTFEGKSPTENVFTGGIGLNLMPPQTGLVGVIDLAFERGSREAASLSESFWRATVTFRVGSF